MRNHRIPEQMPKVIIVRFGNYTSPTFKDSRCVPIQLLKKNCRIATTKCTRKQFLLQVAFAITIHKSQGLTVEKAVVDSGDRDVSLGLIYVALSRVNTRVQGLKFNRSYTVERFYNIKNHMHTDNSNVI